MGAKAEHYTETIETDCGPVRGLVEGDTCRWLGIPYAAPPIGNLRWRPPEPPIPWLRTLDVVAFGPVCAQLEGSFPGFGRKSFTENCLYINVFAPSKQHKEKALPVMVLFPGGGLAMGASDDYDPTALVRDGQILFVSLNYRVNVFGFFSHPRINEEDHPGGNYGIMDQQAALRWVQRNIDKFGGNPGNVTIFGESAGGISVAAHLASPCSAKLFHKAIIQSGGMPITFTHPSVENLEEWGTALAYEAGLNDQTPTNLRDISTTQLLDANALSKGHFGLGRYPFGLMEDGIIVPRSLRKKFLAGDFNRVPLIIGVTKDEFSWFQGMLEFSTGRTTSHSTYRSTLGRALCADLSKPNLLGLSVPPDALDSVLIRYPVQEHLGPSRALAAAIGDAGLISTAGRRAARVIGRHVEDVYTYEFDVDDSPIAWPSVGFPYGSAHTQELQYLFPQFHGSGGVPHPLNTSQQQLADIMVMYWTNFARQGSPNAGIESLPSIPTWPVFRIDQDNVLLLRAPCPEPESAWGTRHQMDFWDSFYV